MTPESHVFEYEGKATLSEFEDCSFPFTKVYLQDDEKGWLDDQIARMVGVIGYINEDVCARLRIRVELLPEEEQPEADIHVLSIDKAKRLVEALKNPRWQGPIKGGLIPQCECQCHRPLGELLDEEDQ